MSDVDPGEGWRLLNVGELVEAGDEYETPGGTWRPCVPEWTGYPTGRACSRFRRRVPAATADARTPKPVAWGVDPGDGLPIWRCSSEAQAHRVVGWMRQSRPELTPDIVPLMDGRGPASHPWCRDVDRDLAARGSEPHDDTIMHRDVPDAIHRLNGLVAGLAERLAELERKVKLAPAANFEAVCNLTADLAAADEQNDELERASLADDETIQRLTAERDAAIRGRDEARAEKAADWKAACEAAMEASKEIGRLKARVAELEAAAKAAPDEVPAAPVSRPAETKQTQAKRVGNGWWFDKSSAPQPTLPPAPPTAFWSNVREETPPASEAGTVRVMISCGIDQDGNVIVAGSSKYPRWIQRASLDLTPAQVADIERQVSGEASSK